MDYVGHEGIFSLKNHSARLNLLSNWCTPAKSRPAEDAHIYARNHQNVGRDLNKPLTLQSAIANASFGKTSSVSASDKRYASLANKPYNLWANVDNFTRESGGRDYAGAKVDSDQDYKSLISWVFVKRLFSAPGCVQPAEITSDKIKLKYTGISAPICFRRLLSFPNIFLCWVLSPQPHSPHTTFCRKLWMGDARGLPHRLVLWGICPILGTVTLAQNGKHPGFGSHEVLREVTRFLPPSTLLLCADPKRSEVGEAAGEWENAGAAWNCMGSVKGQGQRS